MHATLTAQTFKVMSTSEPIWCKVPSQNRQGFDSSVSRDALAYSARNHTPAEGKFHTVTRSMILFLSRKAAPAWCRGNDMRWQLKGLMARKAAMQIIEQMSKFWPTLKLDRFREK